MNEFLVKSKYFIPSTPQNCIVRRKLLENLDQMTDRRLVLVTSPAGFGKTVLVSSWANNSSKPICWLSLSFEDDSPGKFIRYLIGSIRCLFANVGSSALVLAESPNPPDPPIIFNQLINDIIDLNEKITIVLDDYHHTKNPKIHQGMVAFIENLPDFVNLIILSRSDPPFPLAKWRGKGLLAEIRTRDLRFSFSEIQSFYAQMKECTPEIEQLELIEHKSEGWPVGLNLIALAYHQADDKAAFFESLSGNYEFIADYFLEEILNKQDEAVQEFMLKSSILGQFSGDLSDEAIGQINSTDIIDTLFERNLFIVSIDNSNTWFRYHHLFEDLLVKRFQQKYGKSRVEIINRAGNWLLSNGMFYQGIEFLLKANEYFKVMELLLPEVEELWQSGQQSLIVDIGNKIPKETLVLQPAFALNYLKSKLNLGSFRDSRKELRDIQEKNETLAAETKGMFLVIEALLDFLDGNLQGSEEKIKTLVDQHLKIPMDWQVTACNLLGSSQSWAGKLVEGTESFRKALEIAHLSEKPYYILEAGFRYASNLYQQGLLSQTLIEIQPHLDTINTYNLKNTPLASAFQSLRASILHEMGYVESANEIFNNIPGLSNGAIDRTYQIFVFLARLRILLAQKKYAEFEMLVIQIKEIEKDFPFTAWIKNSLFYSTLRFSLEKGDYEEVERSLLEEGVSFEKKASYLNYEKFQLLCEFQYYKGLKRKNPTMLQEALELAENLIVMAEKSGMLKKRIQMGWVKTKILTSLLRMDAATAEVEKTIGLGEEHGCFMLFLEDSFDWIRPFQKELENIPSEKIIPEIRKRLAADHRSEVRMSGAFNLSPREYEVLKMLRTQLTTTEIADRLYISAGTVRTHIKKIYRKLQVHGRTEAVEKAINQKLL